MADLVPWLDVSRCGQQLEFSFHRQQHSIHVPELAVHPRLLRQMQLPLLDQFLLFRPSPVPSGLPARTISLRSSSFASPEALAIRFVLWRFGVAILLNEVSF